MKTLIKVMIFVLLISVFACGKRNVNNVTNKSGSGTTTNTDVSQLQFVPEDPKAAIKTQRYAMTDYLNVEVVSNPKGNRRVYSQISLFYQKVTKADLEKDKTAQDQYNLFYREFVTCVDGPEAQALLSHVEPFSGTAIKAKGSVLNLTNVGQVTMAPKVKGAKTASAFLTFSKQINNRNYTTPLTLNVKTVNDPSIFFSTYAAKAPADQPGTVAQIDCTKAGKAVSGKIPFGDNSTDLQISDLIQSGDLDSLTPSETAGD